MSSQHLERNVEETVEAITRLHDEHRREATPLQNLIDGGIAVLARPTVAAVLVAVVGIWMLGNTFASRPIDPLPFDLLHVTASVAALAMAVLILASQRREDQLAARREKLTLELALLNEQKSAKIIALLEELRRDAPSIADRRDEESEAMGKPTDAATVLSEIENRTARPAVLKKD
ncbi:DUF1003 domain-containing protein [soil metagenome]